MLNQNWFVGHAEDVQVDVDGGEQALVQMLRAFHDLLLIDYVKLRIAYKVIFFVFCSLAVRIISNSCLQLLS